MAVNATPLPTWEIGQEGPRQQEANFTSGAVMPEAMSFSTESVAARNDGIGRIAGGGFAQEIGAAVGDVLTFVLPPMNLRRGSPVLERSIGSRCSPTSS